MSEAERIRTARRVVTQALSTRSRDFRRFVRARVPASEVDDVLQVAALRAVERCGSLQDPQRVLSWLYRLHRNVITDSLRKRASTERWHDAAAELPDLAAPSAHPEHSDVCDCSLAQAQRLNPKHASVLTLVDVHGATLSEAAKSLGITVNNATVRLHRARKALRKAMLEHCGVQSFLDCGGCRCTDDGCCAT